MRAGIHDNVDDRRERRATPSFGSLGAYPTFRLLWLGAFGGAVGQWMQQIAIGWLALAMTDSPAFVGLVAFTAGVPYLVVAPAGGVLIDRLDRRRLMLACQALAAFVAIAVAIDVIAGWAQPPHLIVAAFLNGALQALLTPTQQSIVPALVDRADLTNAVGLMSAGQNLTRIAGPSLAGAVIGLFGVGEAFLLQALALAAAFALVLRIELPRRAPVRTAAGALAGIRLVAGREDLRGLFLIAALPSFLIFPYLSFLNVFARNILQIGAGGLGLLMTASGLGAVTGSLAVATRGRTERTGRLLLILSVVYGGLIVAVTFSRALPLTLPLLFCSSGTASYFMSSGNALLQHRIGDEIRGRVMGAYLLTWGLMPLGALPMGLLAERDGVPAAIAIGAIVSTALVVWLGLSSRRLREL